MFCLHSQSVGSQIAVEGNLSFIGNNAESFEGGALYLSAFGQVKLYRNSHISFVDNIGRWALFGTLFNHTFYTYIMHTMCDRVGSAIVVDVQRTSQVFSQLIFNTQCFLIYEDTTTAPDSWEEVSTHKIYYTQLYYCVSLCA